VSEISAAADAVDFWKRGSFSGRDNRRPQPLFGQVHEDAAVESFALSQIEGCRHALTIGSGGCTAFSLLTQRPERLSVIDINPAQLWLIELKRAAFLGLSYEEMLKCLSRDAAPFYDRLRAALSDRARQFWDSHQPALALGLNQAGVAERNLRRAMILFRAFVHGTSATRRMLSQTDEDGQRKHFHKEWNSWRWRVLFRIALNRRALRLAYAPAFLKPLPKNFAEQMRDQVNDVFLRFPPATNPYLWQTFLAQYPPHGDAGLPVYLQRSHHQTICASIARIELINADLTVWLMTQPDCSIDFFALSNILEVSDATYKRRLFTEITRTAVPHAIVCLRSILPFPPSPVDERWSMDAELSLKAAEMDRSLGCRQIQIVRLRH
jgi:S-adenosylmethionine-diacylglycerol 3-amino-3-carboxypropyl transferase